MISIGSRVRSEICMVTRCLDKVMKMKRGLTHGLLTTLSVYVLFRCEVYSYRRMEICQVDFCNDT